ncbi:mitosis inhibitor protein kinase swe1 [Coemansia sp. RSA 988]|nr:mitosis inhibitor protein kinase swe1 [Coemansia sp. RSA 988]
MANTPKRPVTRSRLRKNHTAQGEDDFLTTTQNSRGRAAPTLRSYASFPALATEGSFTESEFEEDIPSSGSCSPQQTESSSERRVRLAVLRSGQSARSNSIDGSEYGVTTPTPAMRRVHGGEQGLLGCLTPTRNMSPGQASQLSETPSPSPAPYVARGGTQRRLAFSPMRAAGSVAGAAGVGGRATSTVSLFTPPTTKLVRPDPSVFTSAGLQSKKQQARQRSRSSFIVPETPCKRAGGDAAGLMVTPHQAPQHFPSAPKATIEADPFRLGKHRNSSSGSLHRTRKKPHVGAELDTPCRARQNTLVDDDALRAPGFRIPAEGGGRALPPSFAPQHQQLMQSLATEHMGDAPWDTRRGGNRWSWAASSDTGSVSSAATLAPLADFDAAPRAKKRPALPRKLSEEGLADHDDRLADRIAMDMDESDASSAADEDDVFALVAARSPRIVAVERPQMPQIVQGCATNYPHFLRREYFAEGAALPFLAPGDEFRVDGLGYLDYFAHQFEILARAGEGHFSAVFSVRSLVDGELYAVKKTRAPYASRAQRARRLHEPAVLWGLPASPAIARLADAWEQFGHLYLQFELYERGSLAAYLDECAAAQTERMVEPRVWAVLAHAAHALRLLHTHGVAHLDVKPANFLLAADFDTPGAERSEGWLRIADFGHAVRLGDALPESAEEGDREYMAPEVLRGQYSTAADVFSLGMMMLEIAADIVPPDNGVEWHKLREGCFDDPALADLPYSPPLLDTIKQMLHPDPARRPSAAQLLALDQCRLCAADEDADEAFVRVSRSHALSPRRFLLRSATEGRALDDDSQPLRPPMLTRAAAAAKPALSTDEADARSQGTVGLARRATSAPGSAAAQATAAAH